jgi:hypothetical protein
MTTAQSKKPCSSFQPSINSNLKPKFCCSGTMSTLKFRCATMWMKTNGPSKSWLTLISANFTSVQRLSPCQLGKFWLLGVEAHLRRTLASTCFKRTKWLIKRRWTSPEMLMQSLCAKGMCSYLEDFRGNSALTLSRSFWLRTTNGCKWLLWRTSVIIYQRVRSTMSSFTRLEAFSVVRSKRLMILLRCSKLRRIIGQFTQYGCGTHCGPVLPSQFLTRKSY